MKGYRAILGRERAGLGHLLPPGAEQREPLEGGGDSDRVELDLQSLGDSLCLR